MKKIIALILALTCAFALFACNNDSNDEAYAEAVAKFNEAAKASPKTLTVKVTTGTAFGDLNAVYTTTYNEDGGSTIAYAIDKVNGLDSAEAVTTLTGTVTVDASGNYSEGDFKGSHAVSAGFKIDYANDKITCNVNGTTLTAAVAAADSAEVLGVTLPADAVLTVTTIDAKIASVSVAYTVDGNEVRVLCSYAY